MELYSMTISGALPLRRRIQQQSPNRIKLKLTQGAARSPNTMFQDVILSHGVRIVNVNMVKVSKRCKLPMQRLVAKPS